MLESHGIGVDAEVGDGVVVHQIALVPIIRDLLVALRVREIRVVARDGVEGLEGLAVEEALGVLGGFVGHEAVDEGPGCGLGDDAGEGRVEEVWVVGDGFLEAGGAVLGQDAEVDGVAVLLAEFVQGGELGDLDFVVVAAVGVCEFFVGLDAGCMGSGRDLLLIEIATGGGDIALVLVVGA